MATIKTSIMVTDRMSPAFRSMNTAMNIVLNSFEAIQSASSNAVDTRSIQSAREELSRAEIAFNAVEREINEANEAQKRLNNQFRNGNSAVDAFINKAKRIGATIGGAYAVNKILDTSDAIVQTKARLDLMNDGLQTTEQLQQMIFESAERSRGSYLGTADAVSKMGITAADAFSSNAELIAFSEQVNKQFVIAGTSAQGIEAAMLQLTQAMGSGVLRGEELNSIFEQAPTIIQTIADYLDVPIGKIREMASEGQITAEIVKNSLLSAADETNAKFESMPLTISQIWTSIKNNAEKVFEPVLMKISEIANSSNFNNLIGGLAVIASISLSLFEILIAVASAFSNNWSWIGPIVMGITTAMLLYNGALIANSAIQGINTAIQTAQAIATAIKTGVTIAEAAATDKLTVAQWALNSALLANPITWVVVAIIALIAVFYAAVGAVNHFAGTSVSATGIITGVFSTAVAFIGNLFLGLLELVLGVINRFINPFISIANFIGNVFTSPISSVIYLFQGMADTVLGIIESIASAMDFVFGSNMADSISGWRSDLKSMADEMVAEYAPNENYQEVMSNIDLSLDDLGLERFNYGDAWSAGYDFGDNLQSKFDLGNILGGAYDELNNFDTSNALDGIYEGVGNTASNTAEMANSIDMAEEDLKYMRDIAEQEVINRFTTAEIKIDMKNDMKVNSDMDLDGIVAYLEDKVIETMEIAAEGVHS